MMREERRMSEKRRPQKPLKEQIIYSPLTARRKASNPLGCAVI
jgi:hypothetical protein